MNMSWPKGSLNVIYKLCRVIVIEENNMNANRNRHTTNSSILYYTFFIQRFEICHDLTTVYLVYNNPCFFYRCWCLAKTRTLLRSLGFFFLKAINRNVLIHSWHKPYLLSTDVKAQQKV